MKSLAKIVEQALAGKPHNPMLVRALWKERPDVAAWDEELDGLVRDDRFAARRTVVAWVRAAAREAFAPDDDAAIGCELWHVETVPCDDGGYADALALYTRRSTPEVAALVVKGAFTMRDYAAAEAYAKLAGDRRALAGALMHLRRWNEAFALLDDVLEESGPLFGGGGLSVSQSSDDPRVRAIDEACTIAKWASPEVPEWVRAVGGMWEALAGDSIEAELEERFVEGLQRLGSVDDFEVVIRQSRQRTFLRAAKLAARIGSERFADDSWIHSVYGNLARDSGDAVAALASYRRSAELLDAAESEDRAAAWMNVGDAAATAGDYAASDAAFERASELANDEEQEQLEYLMVRSLRKRDASAARARALALLQDLAQDPARLAESDLGVATVELTLDLLLATKDRQALAVQQQLVDAKLALWGECPSVWVERHNLGTIHAQLGEAAQARTLITTARGKLVAQFGEGTPHVQLCDRSLARLDAT